MDEYLSKIVVFLSTPAFDILLLLIVALFLAVKRYFKASLGVVTAAAALGWVCAMPAVGGSLLEGLEREYPKQAVEGVPAASCMVVLGGTVLPVDERQSRQRANSTAIRADMAAELYGAGKTEFIIVSAGNPPWPEGKVTEAEVMRRLLVERGVPQQSMILDMSARTRRENALYSRTIMENIGCEQPLLVASATRMGLAEAAFGALGITVAPVATDDREAARPPSGLDAVIPSKEAFQITTRVLRERVTRALYRYRDWA